MFNPHPIHIGTSGWNYDIFLERLYPKGTPQKRFLEAYATRLKTVELNASFYRSFKEKVWEGWYSRTPPDFLWAVKAPRFFTHIRRLKIEKESMERFWKDVTPLREKHAATLFQLPPNLKYERELLEGFLALLPSRKRIALEARHQSWHEKEVWDILIKRNIAWVISDTSGRYPMSMVNTADFSYIRLHGTNGLYQGAYGGAGIREWLKRIEEWGLETFVYFDNTDDGNAATDAVLMQEMAKKAERFL